MSKIPKTIFASIAAAMLCVAPAALVGCNSSPNVIASAPADTTQSDNANVSSSTNSEEIAARSGEASITEGEVEKFISQYRTYIGTTDDTAFATLLDEAGMTPEDIRRDTIEQLMKSKIAAAKAQEAGIEISDEEIDEYISNVKESLGYAENSKGWSDILDISGYDEDAYRNDIKTKLIVERLVGEQAGSMEATETQMLSYANENPTDYVGANILEVTFKASQRRAATDFAASVNGNNVVNFREAAAAAADNGKASEVVDWGWTVLNVPSSVIMEAIADMKPGQCKVVQDDDGMYKAVYVSEIFVLQPNGRIDYTNMPTALKNKLKSDASAANRATVVSEYLNDLYSEADVFVAQMPEGLSYDVDMTLSTYGDDDGIMTDEEMAESAANQIAEMEKNGTSSLFANRE